MRRVHSQEGMTLVELIIGVSIGAMLITVLGSIVSILVWLPSQQRDKVTVAQDLQFAAHWITRDANSAETYTALSSPDYGAFTWTDYADSSPVPYSVRYYYDSANQMLMREEKINNAAYATFAVAKHVASEGDVTFTWSPGTYSLTVDLKATVRTGTLAEGGAGATTRTTHLTAALRRRSETLVSAPGSAPVPTPQPGSQTYYVASAPVILQGSLVSGGATQLHDADQSYYVVNSTSGGSTKYATYTVQSQSITSPTTISDIQVRFTGQVDRQGVTVNFYVKDSAAGFPSTGESGFTFTSADSDATHAFYLDPATLDYVKSLADRRVDLKIETAGSATFTLSSDQILFAVSP